MLTGVTLCSGGGGSALGLRAAGVQPVGAVEYDAAIAAHYAAQIGAHVTVAPLQETDFRQWIGVDVLQDSNPCPNFSNAKQGGEETPNDLAIADATCRAIRTIRPRYFWLENVEGYAKSESYRRIRAELDNLDYWSHVAVVNAADYGVPQTRRRLILRAVSGGWMQPFRPLPAPVPWVGWYAAIADLLDTLPDTQPAPWQLKRMRHLPIAQLIGGGNTSDASIENGWHSLSRVAEQPAFTVAANHTPVRAFLLNTSDDKWGNGLPEAIAPAPTVRTGQQHLPRAFIVDRALSDRGRVVTVPHGDDPVFTMTTNADSTTSIRAFLMEGTGAHDDRPLVIRQADEPMWTIRSNARSDTARAWLDGGRWVKMTPRALARFQAFPDSYQLPNSNPLACKVLGNAVPPLLAQRITESLIMPERQAVA